MNKFILNKYVQSAFTLQLNGATYAFDFGSESKPETIAAIGKVEAAFVSHKHPDHFDVANLRQLAAPIYGPGDVVAALAAEGLQGSVLHVGQSIVRGGLQVTAIASDHGPNITAPIDNLAFVLKAAGRLIFFLGDMAVPTPAPPGPFDLVLVPVGSSKVFTPKEADDYIRTLGHRGLTVPIHYHGRADRTAGFRFRTLGESFADVRVLDVGESLEL